MIDIVPTKEPYYVNESMSGLVVCRYADIWLVDEHNDAEALSRRRPWNAQDMADLSPGETVCRIMFSMSTKYLSISIVFSHLIFQRFYPIVIKKIALKLGQTPLKLGSNGTQRACNMR